MPLAPRRAGREPFVHIGIIVKRQTHLLQVIQALCAPRRLAGRLHRRQQQRHQDADDGDHDEQFDKCKRLAWLIYGSSPMRRCPNA